MIFREGTKTFSLSKRTAEVFQKMEDLLHPKSFSSELGRSVEFYLRHNSKTTKLDDFTSEDAVALPGIFCEKKTWRHSLKELQTAKLKDLRKVLQEVTILAQLELERRID